MESATFQSKIRVKTSQSSNTRDKIPHSPNSNQTNCAASIVHKEKSKSKTKDLFKKIFARKTKSSKESRISRDNCSTNAIAQSTITMFTDALCITGDEIKITPVTPKCSSDFTANMSSPDMLLYSDQCPIEKRIAPIASVESLVTNDSSVRSSDRVIHIPRIFEEPLSDDNSALVRDCDRDQDQDQECADLLTIPRVDRSRKSSDNDSAVDMKFTDDVSDHGDRTVNSETDSSRCTSSSLVTNDDCKAEKATNSTIESKSTVIKRNDSSSSWRKIKVALVWTPFIQQYARHRYPWIQIAGHQGNFKPGEQGTILKKHTGRESICLQMMCDDNLSDFVPKFRGDVDFEGEKYICMQDLLSQFNMPSLMDIKMGTRTYLEEELCKAKSCPKPRQDMYEKMIEIDKYEPTEEEHRQRAVIKPRYMQWRETLSSTLTLGFRIEGVKKTGNRNNKNVGTQSRNFKRTRYRQEVKDTLLDFIDNNPDLMWKFILRIESLKTNLITSAFFWDHEFIGSSLLFVHDKTGKANVWMIDFGKTVPLPPKCKIDHISPWNEGNHEDGYIFGLDNLLILLHEIHSELSNNSN